MHLPPRQPVRAWRGQPPQRELIHCTLWTTSRIKAKTLVKPLQCLGSITLEDLAALIRTRSTDLPLVTRARRFNSRGKLILGFQSFCPPCLFPPISTASHHLHGIPKPPLPPSVPREFCPLQSTQHTPHLNTSPCFFQTKRWRFLSQSRSPCCPPHFSTICSNPDKLLSLKLKRNTYEPLKLKQDHLQRAGHPSV